MSTSATQESVLQERDDRRITLRILPAVAFSLVVYLSVGMPLAILPTYVHLHLGVSTLLAGLLISLQYIATFASRPRAGRMTDTLGPRKTVRYGLLACAACGAFMVLAALLHHFLWLSFGSLVLSRFALGIGESMSSTGAIMWAIGRVGHDHTSRTISWNGVATYAGLAVGAPLGAALEPRLGLAAVGIFIAVICAVAFVCATRMAPTASEEGEHIRLREILFRVSPYGLALALGGMGFGVIATFITLYFAHLHWEGAALSLTIYGLSFVGVRLIFSRLIDRFGGFPVAIVSFVVETAGLVVLGLGHTHAVAYAGTALTGFGFSLIFPALAVEAANAFPPSVRGSVLGIYSAFVDFSLFLTGPLAGAVISHYGYGAVFLCTAGSVMLALAGTVVLASYAKRDRAAASF